MGQYFVFVNHELRTKNHEPKCEGNMADERDSVDISCSGCERSFKITLGILAKKSICAFCGAGLSITPEVHDALQEIEQANSTSKKTAEPISIECLVCARPMFVKPEQFGRKIVCTYCTAPMMVRSDRSISLATPPPENGGAEMLHDIPCLFCGKHALQPIGDAGANVQCTACHATANMAKHPLSAFIAISAVNQINSGAESNLCTASYAALQARWEKGELSFPEARQMIVALEKLDHWDTGGAFSPFDLETTADVVQHQLAGSSSAQVQREADHILLIFPVGQGQLGTKGGGTSSLIGRNVMGLGLLGMTGTGFIAFRGKKEEENLGEPAPCLLLTQSGAGSEITVLFRSRQGKIGKGSASWTAHADGPTRKGIRAALRRYFAFKALYGQWATGATLLGATTVAIQRRAEGLGAAMTPHAEMLSEELPAPPAFDLKVLRC